MAGIRELLAAVLGVGLGVVFIVAPSFIVTIHTVGRGPHDRRGPYGSADIDAKWLRLVQAIGVALVALGGYFGYSALLA